MSENTLIYPQILRADRDSATGRGQRQESALDKATRFTHTGPPAGRRRYRETPHLRVSRKRPGLSHPCGVGISFLWLPGVSPRATPVNSNGIPSGCGKVPPGALSVPPTDGARRMRKIEMANLQRGMLESGCGFVPQDLGGEMVTRRECPEIRGGTNGGGGGSSCCGFCMGASGGREFCRLGSRRNSRLGNLRYAWRNVVPPGRKPSPCTESTCGGEAVRQRAEIRGQRSEENGGFVLHTSGVKGLTPQDCPEIGGGEHGSPAARTREGGWDDSFVPAGLAPGRGDQPTVGNGGLLSVVPVGLQRRGQSRALPRRRNCSGKAPPPSSVPHAGLRRVDCTLFETPEYPESNFWFRTEVF